jgi:hypothetical protein
MLKFLDRTVFRVVNHFHQSHLNHIHTWHELNQKHFHVHHFNQSWFQGMLKLSMILYLTMYLYHLSTRHPHTSAIPRIYAFLDSKKLESLCEWEFVRRLYLTTRSLVTDCTPSQIGEDTFWEMLQKVLILHFADSAARFVKEYPGDSQWFRKKSSHSMSQLFFSSPRYDIYRSRYSRRHFPLAESTLSDVWLATDCWINRKSSPVDRKTAEFDRNIPLFEMWPNRSWSVDSFGIGWSLSMYPHLFRTKIALISVLVNHFIVIFGIISYSFYLFHGTNDLQNRHFDKLADRLLGVTVFCVSFQEWRGLSSSSWS